MGIVLALICAVVSGACFYFSNGLGEVWAVAWIAALPVLWLAYGKERPRDVAIASFLAYATGQMNMVVGYWSKLPVPTLLLILIVPPVVFALAVLFARFVAQRLSPFLAALAFPALWTAWEYIVAVTAPDGTAGSFAYSQAGVPEMIQGVSVFGIWIVTFLLMLNSSLLAMALRRPGRSRLLAGVALVLYGANVLYGVVRLNTTDAPDKVHVDLIASDALEHAAFSSDGVTALSAISNYLTAAHSAIASGAEIVVMPEKMAVLEPAWRTDALTLIQSAANRDKVTIVAGFDLRGEARRNVAYVFRPGGDMPYEYDKRHMVPGLEAAFQPGLKPGIFAPGRAVAVCKDMDFADMIRADARTGPIRIMFVPAWDFVSDGWAHARMAIMRGVEDGFSLARAGRDGFLTATDQYGRLISGAPTTSLGFVSVSAILPLGSGDTIYLRIGDVFAWLCIVLALLCGGLAVVSRQRYHVDSGEETEAAPE